jgi:flotillin
VEAMAKAEAEKVRLDGLSRAEAERAKGESEAEVIRLKGLAEAEAKQKIAEAFELYGHAAMMDMMIKMLPEYAKQVAAPLSNIDKITVVDTGGGENGGANRITGYATNLMSSLQESLKASSGIDVKELLENFSGKGNVRQSIDDLRIEFSKKEPNAVGTKEKAEVTATKGE